MDSVSIDYGVLQRTIVHADGRRKHVKTYALIVLSNAVTRPKKNKQNLTIFIEVLTSLNIHIILYDTEVLNVLI